MEGDGLSAEQIEQNRGDAKIDKTMRMGYSGENPAAPKGRGAKKTPNVKYMFFDFHYSKRTQSSINFFPK